MSDDMKISHEELHSLFGSDIPEGAVNILFFGDNSWTVEQVREELKKFASTWREERRAKMLAMTEIERLTRAGVDGAVLFDFTSDDPLVHLDPILRTFDRLPKQDQGRCVAFTIAVLTALREPSDGMYRAGAASVPSSSGLGDPLGSQSSMVIDFLSPAFRAMIDHILEGK